MKRSKLWLGLFSLVAILLVAAGCSQNQSASETSSMPEISGFTYNGDIPKNPKKIVNFAYSYTGHLLQLGFNVANYTLDYEKNNPAFADGLKDAKKIQSSDTEAIAAESPDLIIVFAGSQDLDKLKKIAPVLEIKYGAHGYLDMLTQLGKVFGKEDAATEWLNNWESKTSEAKTTLHKIVPASTTFTVMDFFEKNITIYGNNFGRGGELIYDALGYAAPQKVTDEVIKKDGYLSLSQETIGDYVGDYAFFNTTSDTESNATALEESDVWKNTTAYKNNNILKVDENLFYFADPLSLDLQLETFTKLLQDHVK